MLSLLANIAHWISLHVVRFYIRLFRLVCAYVCYILGLVILVFSVPVLMSPRSCLD
jgi:hypothetical protein